jgi:hypothetical protein
MRKSNGFMTFKEGKYTQTEEGLLVIKESELKSLLIKSQQASLLSSISMEVEGNINVELLEIINEHHIKDS